MTATLLALPEDLAALSPAELIDLITTAELDKRRLAALQVQATARYATRQRQAYPGRSAEKTTAATCREIALARHCSPRAGNTWVGMATALTTEMPETLRALQAGHIGELTARDVVGRSTHLTREDRGTLDATIVTEYQRPGATRGDIAGAATALADQLDPAAGVARRKKAEGTRRTSLRPAQDCMTYFGAVLPVEQGVAVQATLRRDARDWLQRDPTDERTEDQVMADLLVERVTGQQCATDPVPVAVSIVMTEQDLFRGGDGSAQMEGAGPIPARLARQLVFDAAEADQVFVRRLYTSPDRSALVGMDAKSRLFPAGLARFLRLRDRQCATPWCGAPIRHVDHVTPWSKGGRTTVENGQGLCRSCNWTKDLEGFSTESDGAGGTVFTTRTGHRYERKPPPPVGRLRLPERCEVERRGVDRRRVGRRSSDPVSEVGRPVFVARGGYRACRYRAAVHVGSGRWAHFVVPDSSSPTDEETS